MATLKKQEIIAVDTETTGLTPDSDLCGISLAWKAGQGVYVPTLSPDAGSHLDKETVLSILKEVLEDPSIKKCGHNIKFDARILGAAGVWLKGVVFDSMLASILIDPARPGHKLEQLALDLLGYRMTPISDLIGMGAEDGCLSMAEVPLERIADYAAEDADISLRLYHELLPRLRELGMEELVCRSRSPLGGGHRPDGAQRDHLRSRGAGPAGGGAFPAGPRVREKIFEYAGGEFNPDSPKQLAEVLFERLGLAPGKKTKTGYSTDIEELTRLAAQEDKNDPKTLVPGLIIEYRQLAKLISTYLGNLRDRSTPRRGESIPPFTSW